MESIIGQRQFLFLYLAGAVAENWATCFCAVDIVVFAASGGVARSCWAYTTILPELELPR